MGLSVALSIAGLACSQADGDSALQSFTEPDSFVVQPIEIADHLRLREGFDYSTYYGVIRLTRDLRTLWSQLVSVRHSPLRAGILPAPPAVDFSRAMVLWFADRGAAASFVRSIGLDVDSLGETLTVTVTAYHSDFGSRRLNLWEIPRTGRAIVFEVEHEYEDRAP